jgi:hypothetical protein
MAAKIKKVVRLLGIALVLALFLRLLSGPAQASDVTVDEPNLFSYQIPEGWTLQSMPSARYKVARDIENGQTKASIRAF